MQAVRAERAVRGRVGSPDSFGNGPKLNSNGRTKIWSDPPPPLLRTIGSDVVRGVAEAGSEPKAAIIDNDKPPTLHRRDTAQLNREQRLWANYHDVFSVEESLRRDLHIAAGESETVAAFVRHVLYNADRVEHWQPIASFPFAVALAQERVTGRPLTDATERVVGVLDQWCASYSKDDVRPQ
jgi:hypothetical protein